MTEVEMVRLPGPGPRGAHHLDRSRCGDQRVADAAERAGYVFAVDPTSMEASCIGGNIAMNAGGKKAVLWGTALDNLASWRMVTPNAEWLEVTRSTTTWARSTTPEVASFELQYFEADGKLLAPSGLDIPGASSRRRAWART